MMVKSWLLMLLIPFSHLNAQVSHRKPENFMTSQIKHVSDFVDRFNNAAITNKNESGLRALFNEDDTRLNSKGRVHHPYASRVDAFIEMIGTGHIRITKRSVMHAVIGIKVACQGRPDTLIVHLRKDYTTDSAAYWHVIKVEAPFATATDAQPNRKEQPGVSNIDLPPNAHEVSFLPLLRGLHDYASLAPFTHCLDCRDVVWERIENALQAGRLTAEAVVSNRIWLEVRNWKIELSEFIREKENSGWLISDLIEN
jgi:hypothetical protein